MGVDGLMSDQLFIESNSETIADIILEVQERTISELYALKGNKSAEEFIRFIERLNVEEVIFAKADNAIAIFEATHSGMLQSIQGFSTLSEETLQALVNYNRDSLLSQLDNMAQIVKREVINGIVAGSPVQSVLNKVRSQGALSRGQLLTLINTAMNEYSRNITKLMIDKMPEKTQYQYIGALDEKTRPECLEMMSAGNLTKKEIEATFGSKVFTEGGGYNCRHKWEIALQDKFGHDPEGAKKLLDEKDLN
jgi:hypothetical protein|tara:strand:- start:287 stop:1039 length:753 start_codon:yes stop_codon:yes gene_type:complete